MKRETFLNKDIGYTYKTKEIPITVKDVKTIYDFLGERETIFTDDDFAKSLDLRFKGKIVAGLFLLMMFGKLDGSVGLAFDAVMLAMNNIKVLAPAYVGDHLRLEGELIYKRLTSKGHTVVTWKWMLINQNDVTIMTGENTELFANKMAST
ncbi:MAG: MaoC family dehydratase [Dehalococcoidales bacterium]|nr:MaoC family dehydratase [Dehalococcoidales bacterium]